MNCSQFEGMVVGIAREEPLDRAAREDAFAHAQGCARCAHRLAGEKVLSAALKAAAAESAVEAGAPPEVEKLLLASLRERHVQVKRHRLAWMARAAAGAAAAIVVLASFWWFRQPEPPRAVVEKTAPAVQPVKVIAPVYHEVQKPPAPRHVAQRKAMRPRETAVTPEIREMVTDFMPVFYDPAPIEHGRLVRVRLPRVALVSFGLPMNEQLADESVKADVLVGEDGLARAVRFVK